MNIKASYKYQLADHIKSIVIFYGVILAILLLTAASVSTMGGSSASSFSGIDLASAIFLFVVGLCCFKETFLMLIQNGVSRKRIFLSRVLVLITVASLMAAIDKVVYFLGKAIAAISGGFKFIALYEMAYTTATHGNIFLMHVNILIFDFLMYTAFVSAGYLIALLFYRLNKAGKIAVGAGVPVTFFFVLPLIDTLFFDSKIGVAIIDFLNFALGITTANPYAAMITFTVSSAVLWAFSWLMLRKAVVKA